MVDRKHAPGPSSERPSSGGTGGWFGKADMLAVAVLLGLVTLGWCAANGKWTAAQWALPSAYLDPEKCDVIHALAMMKAAGDGEFVPLAWKRVSRLGAPDGANWNDWPLLEELQIIFFGLLAKAFGLFGALNVGMLLGHWAAAATFYAVARTLGCLRSWAFVGGLAYGLAPFLFAQSPHHITTEYVWHVPLFILVWKWVSTDGGLAWGSRRFWAAIAIAVVTGLQSPYFTNVLCQLALLGGAALAWRHRSLAALKPALAVVGAAAVAFAAMNLDTWRSTGSNSWTSSFRRSPTTRQGSRSSPPPTGRGLRCSTRAPISASWASPPWPCSRSSPPGTSSTRARCPPPRGRCSGSC